MRITYRSFIIYCSNSFGQVIRHSVEFSKSLINLFHFGGITDWCSVANKSLLSSIFDHNYLSCIGFENQPSLNVLCSNKIKFNNIKILLRCKPKFFSERLQKPIHGTNCLTVHFYLGFKHRNIFH